MGHATKLTSSGTENKKKDDSKESPPPYSRMDENIVALEAIRVADPQEPRLSGYITPNHQDGSLLLVLAHAILKFLLALAHAILKFLSAVTHESLVVLLTIVGGALTIVGNVLNTPLEILLYMVRFTGWALAIVFLVLVIMVFANFDIMVKLLEKLLGV